VRRLLWFMLATLTAALLALVARSEGGTAGLAQLDIAALALKVGLVVFIGTLALALFRERFSRAVDSALFWIVIAILFAIGYAYRGELRDVADRVMAEFLPGHAVGRAHVVEIGRLSGNFSVTAQLNNGARVAMVIDTGASSVVLTQDAARAAGLPVEVLTYTVNIETANGRTRAAPVTLDSLAVGSIVERAVPALIAQRGQLRSSLLGMSFLSRLESWEVRGEKLVMRGYP